MSFEKGFWKPNRKQAQFLSIPTSIKEAAYLGGAGSGKSDVLLVYGLVWEWHKNPSFKQLFLRRTFPELKNEIVPRAKSVYPKFGATFNQSDMIWTFPRLDQFGSGMRNSGAIIKLGHCEDDNDVKQYDSMEITLFTPDEITSFTEYQYLYITFERNRAPKDSGLIAITRTAGMPGGVGHTFTKKRFFDIYPQGGKIIVGKGGNKRVMIHATLEDNKDYIDPNYRQSLEGRPEAEKRAKLYGDFNAYSGQVFDEFRDRHYPDEPINAIHVIEPFEIPQWWPRIVVGDWGFAAMCYIGFYAISPQKRLYLYRELHWLKTRIAEWGPVVKTLINKEQPKIVKFCQSAAQDRGEGHTIQQQIETELGIPITLSVNKSGSRVAGKMLIHEYLRWQPRVLPPVDESRVFDNSYAMWLQRNKGLNEYREYINSFKLPEVETNIPKLQIFKCSEDTNHDGHPNCCPAMIDAIKACSYARAKGDDKPVEDVAEFNGDDPYDDLRYAVDTADNYFVEAEQEFAKVTKQAELLELLQNTGNWTGFYRGMEKAESESRVEPIRRYRH